MAAGFFPRDELFMRLAIREAQRALQHDDVPVGALIVLGGAVIALWPAGAGARHPATAAGLARVARELERA